MKKNYRRLAILGSTGSIGCNTLNVIENLNANGYSVKPAYLTTNSRIDILAEQIKKFSPRAVVIHDLEKANEFKSKYNFDGLEIHTGPEGLVEIAGRDDYDMMVCALVGFSGLEPTIKAIETGKRIALANKETLVVAGEMITGLLKKHNTELIPIDSEHSAILQCITGENPESISKVILTASGGPFRDKSYEEMKNSSVENALNHPNWNMGNKITIDSATLMNKGLEVIEAKWLFEKEAGDIQVVIHPQSIIHSMVEFTDGSIKAQLGIPDMKIPIQYAMTFPNRVASDFPRMDFKKYNNLTFEEPDYEKFECLQLAFDVLKEGGTYPAVLNAANEIAVDLFLSSKIGFTDIPCIIKDSLDKHKNRTNFDLEDIIEVDKITRDNILGVNYP